MDWTASARTRTDGDVIDLATSPIAPIRLPRLFFAKDRGCFVDRTGSADINCPPHGGGVLTIISSSEATMSNRCFLLALVVTLALSINTAAAGETFKIGVLAKNGPVKALKMWKATGDYLSQKINGMAFEIVPLQIAFNG